jgi:hypothetical protein
MVSNGEKKWFQTSKKLLKVSVHMRMAEKVRNNYQTSDILHKTVAKWLY